VSERRIVIVSPYRSEYGPRQVLEHVSLAVAEAGHRPVLAVPEGASLSASLRETAEEIVTIEGLTTFPRTFDPVRLTTFFRDHLHAASQIEALVRERDARGVYSISEAIFCGSLGARRAHVPNVVHAIGMSIQSPRWGASVYIRLLDRLSDQLVACSSAVAEMFTRYGIEDMKCIVVHNGISVDGIQSSEAQLPPKLHDGPRVGMVAAFDPRKGHELFIESAARVVREFPDARFYLIGGVLSEQPESVAFEQRIRRLIADRGLEQHVEFVGYVADPDVYVWMRAMDVIVVPSRTEAFAHALLEAMACHRPIVATRIEGNLDAFTEGHSGLYVRREPGAMASAISSLLGDPDRAAAMGAAAADRVRRYFDLSVTVPANAWVVDHVFGDGA
jgi:glycosyltransferase involved in cell wall biosynthesis